MQRTARRGLLAVLIGAGVAMSGAYAAFAAPAAAPPFTVTATDMTYGQPDDSGTRSADNTITITNTGTATIQYPMLTFPANGRDIADQSRLPDCPRGGGTPAGMYCITDPLAAGASRTLSFGWLTTQRGPDGTAEVRVEQAIDAGGTPMPGTATTATWHVSFAPLTGTFDITATPLAYGPVDRWGIRHGVTTVTITNLSTATVPYPLVTFPASSGDAGYPAWKGCVAVIRHVDDIVCVEKPLAPGKTRAVKFSFYLVGPTQDFDASVRVDAGADLDGTVIPGTGAGTTYPVTAP
jgi:hypothetical protein